MGAIAFVTTAWGPRHGGINAFNMDLCEAVASLPDHDLRVICFVLEASREDIADAAARGVMLVAAEGPPVPRAFAAAHRDELAARARDWGGVDWWIGHDVISGGVVLRAAEVTKARAAVIQHTDYGSYGALKGTPGEAIVDRNIREVDTLLQSHAVFGVGPKLARTARDRVRSDGARVVELVPGLARLQPIGESPHTFRAITFGRLDPVSDLIKQGKLAVRAFGRLIKEVPEFVGPDPRITVIGIDRGGDAEEADLRALAEEHAGRAVSVLGHPFTEDRERLFRVLADSSVCLMLSLHEGFGLAGWEAIAAEVPLILSRNSGLYELLDGYEGLALGCVRAIDVKGGDGALKEDVRAVTNQLRAIAVDPAAAKRKARSLRELLSDHTWERTARVLLEGLGLAPADGDGGADTVALPSSNLPLRADAFVERPDELAECMRELSRQRLVTLVGTPGSGKTRFALELAKGLLGSFDEHVYFVDLTTVSDPSLVVNSITRALRIEAGEPVIDALTELFRGTRALLLLDNFEHVREAAETVQRLLDAVAGLTVLATSREPLLIGAEKTLDLPPLPLNLAARLFVNRAAEHTEPPSADDPDLRLLCERLDCLPLAIELVAPRARLYTLRDLLSTIQESLLDVERRQQDVPERQRSLRAAIEWSYARLVHSEQRLFAELSVFAGGCTIQTAFSVLRGGPPDMALERDLMSLLDKRLLREDARTSRRFGMLGTLREFAMERLEAAPGTEEVRRRHAEHFLAFAESASRFELDMELDNLSAALTHFVGRQDVEEALRLVAPLGQFWWARDFAEGHKRLSEVLRLRTPGRLASLRAEVQMWAGRLAIRLGRLDEAAAAFDERVEIARREGNPRLEARALADRALVHMERAEFNAAQELLECALPVQRELADDEGLAETTDSLGVVATGKGDYDVADECLQESLALYRIVPDRTGVAWVHNDLARLALAQNDLVVAKRHADEALAIGDEETDWAVVAWARNYLGLVASQYGDFSQAHEHHGESLKLVRLLGDRRPQALALEGFAALAAQEGEAERALRLTGAADALRANPTIPRTGAEATILEIALVRARAELSDAEAEAATAAGQIMSPEDAVALARGK